MNKFDALQTARRQLQCGEHGAAREFVVTHSISSSSLRIRKALPVVVTCATAPSSTALNRHSETCVGEHIRRKQITRRNDILRRTKLATTSTLTKVVIREVIDILRKTSGKEPSTLALLASSRHILPIPCAGYGLNGPCLLPFPASVVRSVKR